MSRHNRSNYFETAVTDIEHPEVKFPPDVSLVLPCQTHTTNVEIVLPGKTLYPETDALISFEKNIAVGVRTADCVPVLIYAPDVRAVAAIHAGWKGSIGGIAARCIDKLKEHGAEPRLMEALIGPCICRDCYEVSESLASDFINAGFASAVSHRQLDLREVNRMTLLKAGVEAGNIDVSPLCTRHSRTAGQLPLFPSWRREPGITQRLISAIRLT